jgi:hypothetical protein
VALWVEPALETIEFLRKFLLLLLSYNHSSRHQRMMMLNRALRACLVSCLALCWSGERQVYARVPVHSRARKLQVNALPSIDSRASMKEAFLFLLGASIYSFRERSAFPPRTSNGRRSSHRFVQAHPKERPALTYLPAKKTSPMNELSPNLHRLLLANPLLAHRES